jgi:hypothetical protein
MDRQSQADACWVEHKILEHVKAALRLTLDWNVPAVGLPRKLSSVSFTLKSFERHLTRLMKLEESGGYMIIVGEHKPNLLEQADLLLADHEEFRARLAEVVPATESLSAQAPLKEFQEICESIRALLDRVDEHDRREVELIQD